MQLKAFTVFDMKTEAYLKPFFCLTSGEAIRTFSDAVNEAGTPFNRHAADYTLFEIGAFNDSLGQLDSCPPGKPGLRHHLLNRGLKCRPTKP